METFESFLMKKNPTYYQFKNDGYHMIYTQSPFYGEYDVDFLKKNNITHIISLTNPVEIDHGQAQVLNYFIKDFGVPQDKQSFIKFVKYVKSILKAKNILIHCHGGNGRTGMFLAALMKSINPSLNMKEVINNIRQKNKNYVETKQQEDFLYNIENELGE